jgi:hypothetical protein
MLDRYFVQHSQASLIGTVKEDGMNAVNEFIAAVALRHFRQGKHSQGFSSTTHTAKGTSFDKLEFVAEIIEAWFVQICP